MALINLTDRDPMAAFLISPNPHLGPGTYEVNNSFGSLENKLRNMKQPPFGTSAGLK